MKEKLVRRDSNCGSACSSILAEGCPWPPKSSKSVRYRRENGAAVSGIRGEHARPPAGGTPRLCAPSLGFSGIIITINAVAGDKRRHFTARDRGRASTRRRGMRRHRDRRPETYFSSSAIAVSRRRLYDALV